MLFKKTFKSFPSIIKSTIKPNSKILSSLSQTNLINNTPLVCKFSPKFNFSALSIKDMKVTYDPSQKTQILSLSQQQLQQLASIPSYMTSITFLQKNDLQKSLQYLNFSLNEARNNFPESINLHMCILNRKAILLKLLSQNKEFVEALEEIFLLSQSLKGLKNLDTQKHLGNYLLSLLFQDRSKMAHVIQFVQSLDEIQSSPKLQKKIKDFVFFDAIADLLVRNQPQTGLQKLESLPQQTFHEKYFKTNNLTWMKFVNWKITSKSQTQFSKKVKDEGEELLKTYLRALFEMEYCVPDKILQKNEQQVAKNSPLIQLVKSYLVGNAKELRFIPDQVKLGNPQSLILTMNIANLLFQSQRYEQCVYFMKLSLSTALDHSEVQRVGLCLLLLGRINFKGGQNYEEILLGLLDNAVSYPTHIVKEALSLYSQFLFKQARYIEAQNYANQMMKLQGDLHLEGLLLPQYNFIF